MRQLKRPIEEIRAELMADPSTQNIAAKLGMELAAYVEKVLDYLQNPDKQPELNVLPEGEAKAQGAATTEEVKQWFEDVISGKVDLRPASQKDAFVAARRKGPALK